MNILLSDRLVAKYRSLPESLWYLFAFLSIFFARAYEYIVSASSSVLYMNSALAEANLPLTVQPAIVISVSCILSALLAEVLFEIINHLASGILLARFSAKTNRSDLKFRLRLCYIYANILTGLIGVAYFFTQNGGGVYTGLFNMYESSNDVQLILNAIVPFSALTYFIYLFFADIRQRFLPKKNHARALLYVGRIYFGIALIVTLVQNFTFLTADQPVLYTVSDWLDFGIRVLWAVLAYLYYRRLKKQPTDDDPDVTVVVEQSTHKNIYDDFGF